MSEPTPAALPFSVLMSYYAGDRPDHLEEAFLSVTAHQDLPPAEVVLVRDGPVGRELAERVTRLQAESAVPVRHVELATNQGLAGALTAGLAEVHHAIVARMDADDVSLPSRFAVQVPLIAEGLDLVGSAITEFGEEAAAERTRPVVRGADGIANQARLRSPFNHPSVVFRISAVQSAGGYVDLGMMEDYWLWVRMIAAGAKVDNVDEVLVRYRVSDGAYGRRGGWTLLRSELSLQRAMRRAGFTTRREYARNVLVRGAYRMIPESFRRALYRLAFVRRSGRPRRN